MCLNVLGEGLPIGVAEDICVCPLCNRDLEPVNKIRIYFLSTVPRQVAGVTGDTNEEIRVDRLDGGE